MADIYVGKDSQYHILQPGTGEAHPEHGTPVYDAVEVEEVHNSPAEEMMHNGYSDDGMGVTEIETDTGLELNAPTYPVPKIPPAVSPPGMARRPRTHSTVEPVEPMERVEQVKTVGKSVKEKRRGKRTRAVSTGSTGVEEGKGAVLRTFQLKWLLMYEWLRYDPDKQFMHCSWCQTSGRKNAFGKPEGTNNFRKSNCEEHQKSNDHKKAAEDHGLKCHTYRTDASGKVDPIMKNVTAVRGPDGNVLYQGNTTLTTTGVPLQHPALEQNPDIRFHAKKAHMLLSGFLCQKNLPPSLSKEMLDIMPFMFPDSKIAAEIANLNLP